MSKWDDDFDFDDDAPKNKKAQPEKKKIGKDNDFFDEDDTNKLPSIGSKNTISKQLPQNKRSSAKPNPYVENMKLRGNIYDDDENVYEEIEDEPKVKPNKNSAPVNAKKKQSDQNIDYYEDIQQQPKKSPKKDQKKSNVEQSLLKKFGLEKQEDHSQNYEEEVFQDGYGDDFQEVEPESPPKKVQPTVNTQPPQNKKTVTANPSKNDISSKQNEMQKKIVSQPPKPPSRASQASKQEGYRNLTVQKNAKNGNIRSQSRQSMKSAESKRGAKQSRVNSNKFSTNMSFVTNKYSNEIDKSFPEVNLREMNQDKINKLNEKLRSMIKKFNQELNELINKNMLYLKSKKTEKSVNVDTKLRILEEQSKNNETMIDVMQKQFDKLSGRDGELREEEYQLMTEKKIEQVKQLIKESQKTIVKLKTEIKSEGNKLTNKNEDKKMVAELHHLKTTLMQSKKDQEKQNQRIQKLDEQMQDLGEKITDVDYRLSELLDQAKEKGIQLESKEELHRKFDTIKKRLEASKNHRSKLESLLKTKSDIISHEKEQMRINIKNCELEIKNLYDSISHVHNESVKVVEKAKASPKITPNLIADLDSILKSLELAPFDNYSVRSDENKSQHSNRPLKNSAIGNMEKSEPQKRSESANNTKHSVNLAGEDSNKPNLVKKKIHQMPQEKKNEAHERVWRDEEKQKHEENPKKQHLNAKEKEKEPEKPAEEEKDKKKPFTLKKNRVSAETKPEAKPEVEEHKGDALKLQTEEKKNQQEKKEEVSLAGPRMMKFRRRNQQKQAPKEEQKPQKLVIEQKPEQEPLKIEQEKPSYVPKRFNLRNREKKEDSYVPSVETKEKQEPKKQSKPEPVLERKNEQNRKLILGEGEKPKKPTSDLPEKKDNHPEKISVPANDQKKDDEESKPRFNLRLRDRKKNAEEGVGGYVPSVNDIKLPQQKPALNLGPKQTSKQVPKQNKNLPPQQNVSNPYAPKQSINNPYAPKENSSHLGGNKYQPKQELNLGVNKQVNNPYAPQTSVNKNEQANLNNPYAQNQGEGRKKEGPVKKPKPQQMGQKQKFNIYEQAEEAQGLNQFVSQPKVEKKQPETNFNPVATKDLNLNDLLGVKNKKNDDLADLIGGGNTVKKAKKNNDFFGDMDL